MEKRKEKKIKNNNNVDDDGVILYTVDRSTAGRVRSPSVQCDLNVKRVPASRCIIRTKDTYSRVAINATTLMLYGRANDAEVKFQNKIILPLFYYF